MPLSFLVGLSLAGAVPAGQMSPSSCANEVNASATAYRLADLPAPIRNDLALVFNGAVADTGTPILQTDAPSEAERNLATVRFLQAIYVKHTWFVSLETSMTTPRTIGYGGSGAKFQRIHFLNLAGPPCEAIKAALKGVTSFLVQTQIREQY